jgi:hypothetical protein
LMWIHRSLRLLSTHRRRVVKLVVYGRRCTYASHRPLIAGYASRVLDQASRWLQSTLYNDLHESLEMKAELTSSPYTKTTREHEMKTPQLPIWYALCSLRPPPLSRVHTHTHTASSPPYSGEEVAFFSLVRITPRYERKQLVRPHPKSAFREHHHITSHPQKQDSNQFSSHKTPPQTEEALRFRLRPPSKA